MKKANLKIDLWRCLGVLHALFLLNLPYAAGVGGEVANLSVPLFASLGNHTHRQNICHRYDMVRAGEISLREALSGMSLQPLMALGDFFNYDPVSGIDPEEPGLMVDLLDALAESANFTWRKSFGVMEEPEVLNRTWTSMLMWAIENYDVAVNWWDLSVERMEMGAAYIEPWFDGSIILIDQKDPPIEVDTIIWFNWLSPFENSVWMLTLFTILLSSLVYQFIEYIHDEREDRPFGQWFSDNLYLSSLNFTQNFEYAPNSVAGRIFGVSMGMWALVMTATYTANLASLFVQVAKPPLVVDSIDQAIALEIPICTMGLTNSDSIIQAKYTYAKRVPKATELEAYQALRRGECGLVASYRDNWLGYQGNSEYNPECDLEWVGRVVETIKSGFAVKADAGHLCTSLIRDVLNLHMVELIGNGVLLSAWNRHRQKTKDQDCDDGNPDSLRRRLAPTQTTTEVTHRKLKGGGRGAAAAVGGASGSESSLTVNQMMGTFAMHWVVMLIAIIVSLLTSYFERWKCRRQIDKSQEKVAVKNRSHGPIIGHPPRLNSVIIRNVADRSPQMEHIRREKTVRWPSDPNSDANGNDKQPCNQRIKVDTTFSDSEEPEWRRSHMEMQQKQQDLAKQMNSVLDLLNEMRIDQLQLLQNQQRQQQQQQRDRYQEQQQEVQQSTENSENKIERGTNYA